MKVYEYHFEQTIQYNQKIIENGVVVFVVVVVIFVAITGTMS